RCHCLWSPPKSVSPPASGNLHCPRKLSVPCRVQGLGSQIHWPPFRDANPIVAHGVGVHRITTPPSCLMSLGDGDSGQSNLVVLSQPLSELTVLSQPKNLS